MCILKIKCLYIFISFLVKKRLLLTQACQQFDYSRFRLILLKINSPIEMKKR